QFQMLSSGGSDASCAASHGLCARPITLGLPMESTHGYEVIHPGSMEQLARLTAELVRRLED
ncbi:MAG: M42 family peptidase, partial [Fimbriimonas sp.]